MGYLSCNAKCAIATCQCDPQINRDLKKHRKTSTHHKLPPEIREFQYSDLVAATNGFSPDSFLGKGSHGSVYRATLDGGNLIAAVKTTKFKKPTATNHSPNCTGCSKCSSPAENEIEILSRVRSPRRLVNLIGFSTDSNHNKLIVVQYMPNGSLYDLLHSTSSTPPPGWTPRLRFALQVAKAVHTLHSSNPPVIHRDIKSSNVLMDEDWNARLGDFGLALRGHVEDVRVKSTPPAGTLGYLDPCYLAPGDLSAKSDVFSFGILLLEMMSGRNAIDVKYSPPSVVEWAVPLIKRGEFLGICDPRIGTPSDPTVIEELTVLAARCVRSTAEKRPLMEEVVECLKEVRKRIEASRAVWKSVKRRVLRRWEVSEEVVVKGGKRRNGKVSSVGGVEEGTSGEEGRNNYRNHEVVMRTRSIGCDREMKMEEYSKFVRRNGYGSSVGVRLNKSRSMGFLQTPSLLHYGAILFEVGRVGEIRETGISVIV
ncbi:serine/threonine-protein kinase-like protein [Senna tora]|uniref:Serine/threonine-protein kinase-like protein n=1 Tax=Senna tora TaxID=362788 RepID=A0A834T9W1_9FABA|nr:serine/threonine-protein kinase-like protein [Senna tora]